MTEEWIQAPPVLTGETLAEEIWQKVLGRCWHRKGMTRDLAHCETECASCGAMIPDREWFAKHCLRAAVKTLVDLKGKP